MSAPRLVLLVSLAALTLLALPAASQAPSPGGSLAINGLPDSRSPPTSNQTQAVLPFTVQVNLNQGTCVGGSGQFKVDLTATLAGSNASAEVQPSSLTFQVPQSETLAGAYSSTGGAVLVLRPGLVRENTTVPVTVKAATSVTCSAPGVGMSGGASSLSTESRSAVTFVPVSEEVRNAGGEAMPGLEVPALLAAVAVAVLAARRRA